MTAALVVAGVVAAALADLRWLRVAQREHYIAGSSTRFAVRWWGLGPNKVLAAAAVLGTVLSPISPISGLVAAAAIAVGPFRYRLRGSLAWTRRLTTTAVVVGGVQILLVAAGVLIGQPAPVAALVAPLVVDLALRAMQPLEDRRAERFVAAARARLEQVHPTVIGITGSYGKTTTKFYAAHLIAGARSVVATPASFNNRAGLSRAINEHLGPGTEVFVAEMGTYGKGEIAELCAWCPPRVATITAIGPVHLERFGTEDAIVAAKSEIFEQAEIVIVNLDDPRLVKAAAGRRTIGFSTTDPTADVCARACGERIAVTAGGDALAEIPASDIAAGNVACAVALARAVDTPLATIADRLATLPAVPNRRAQVGLSTGALAVDDTFNSNPAGCRAALDALVRLSTPNGKRVVVTPGMVELGSAQQPENAAFAQEAASRATHLVIVGFTNRAALLSGARGVPKETRAEVMFSERHEHAVTWVRANTRTGDVVLYEGQLPDHYP